MAPIKFEEKIKNKLDKRTIKPSADAWNNLSERLDAQDKKSNKPYWWFGIAASVIGVLFVISQFLNNDLEVYDTPIIVETPEIIKNNENITVAIQEETPETIEEAQITNKKESFKVTTNKKRVASKEAFIAVTKEDKISSDKKTNPIAAELPKQNLTFEEQKIQDVVAQVQSMKLENKVITDADIDALLKEAQKEIIRNRLYNETTNVVDANALLQDVEAELDQSFRAKVFEALKSSYNSVKTAVAQRNE
ncbi:MAG: hypothetical protein P8K68_05155 [Algibacter sp.]|uniref:hypothetical protein n=1 Tax=Algibacter sp. TaxID=1872428 RepID=UPI0026080D24|nr:hypothetical protein [Algibacter sp.]MDG1728478.1 hypothetical protein [Algibacter sp.]MDG2178164.1 hypothetical protein [Algibacter sp.]